MQRLINVIFFVAAVCVVIGSAMYAIKSLDEGGDYGTGWLWGVISAFCVWAVIEGIARGLFWV